MNRRGFLKNLGIGAAATVAVAKFPSILNASDDVLGPLKERPDFTGKSIFRKPDLEWFDCFDVNGIKLTGNDFDTEIRKARCCFSPDLVEDMKSYCGFSDKEVHQELLNIVFEQLAFELKRVHENFSLYEVSFGSIVFHEDLFSPVKPVLYKGRKR